TRSRSSNGVVVLGKQLHSQVFGQIFDPKRTVGEPAIEIRCGRLQASVHTVEVARVRQAIAKNDDSAERRWVGPNSWSGECSCPHCKEWGPESRYLKGKESAIDPRIIYDGSIVVHWMSFRLWRISAYSRALQVSALYSRGPLSTHTRLGGETAQACGQKAAARGPEREGPSPV